LRKGLFKIFLDFFRNRVALMERQETEGALSVVVKGDRVTTKASGNAADFSSRIKKRPSGESLRDGAAQTRRRATVRREKKRRVKKSGKARRRRGRKRSVGGRFGGRESERVKKRRVLEKRTRRWRFKPQTVS
jgi:hypothetical protein